MTGIWYSSIMRIGRKSTKFHHCFRPFPNGKSSQNHVAKESLFRTYRFQPFAKYVHSVPIAKFVRSYLWGAFDKRNFRKRVADLNYIEKTDKIDKTGSKRGAALYKFNENAYRKAPKFKL